jgi:carbamate kinase
VDTIVIALGGNALLKEGERPTFNVQIRNVIETANVLARAIVKTNAGIAITHGKGPQVGDELVRNEYAKAHIPMFPLHVLAAETQAVIGSMLELALRNEFERLGIRRKVSVVITHVEVDPQDPAFKSPSKPIGPFYTKARLEKALADNGKPFEYVKEDGMYRRVVASPRPMGIVELDEIKHLLDKGHVVICCGGGGIPVHKEKDEFRGSDCIIDKDYTTAMLAKGLHSGRMVILTDTGHVYSDFPKNKAPIESSTALKLEPFAEKMEGGTMKPKVEACVMFIKHGGKSAAIGNLSDAENVVVGRSGTQIS